MYIEKSQNIRIGTLFVGVSILFIVHRTPNSGVDKIIIRFNLLLYGVLYLYYICPYGALPPVK